MAVLLRKSHDTGESNKDNYLLVQLFLTQCKKRIQDTGSYFSFVISAMQKGWKEIKMQIFFIRFITGRIIFSLDGLLCFRDQNIIPSSSWRSLNLGQPGVDKTKFLRETKLHVVKNRRCPRFF